MTEAQRRTARELAQRYLESGDPLGWFEELYAAAGAGEAIIPWADMRPNPNLVEWLDRERVEGQGRRALKVGCGLGDDAEELAVRGFAATAFDISSTAIERCRARFPESGVGYAVANLLDVPEEWSRAFDLVVESYTLQVLPPELRSRGIACIADLVAPGGTLLVIARGRERSAPPGKMPWPLLRTEVESFTAHDLELQSFEDYVEHEDPPVRRFRAVFMRE